MKILLITDLYPVKKEEITTPRTLYDFVQEWQKSGHQVKIIKPNFILNSFIRKKPFYKTGWYEDVYNVNYWLPFCGNIKHKLKNFYKKEFEPDVVIAHMPSGILYADKLGLPFIAGIHNSDITVLTKKLYSFYFKTKLLKALKNSCAIACRSHVLWNKLIELYPEFINKSFVAPSGINKQYIVDTPTHTVNPPKLKVITCANFKKRKNIDKIILGLKNHKALELTVIGDGEDRPYLESLCDRVKFTGHLPNSKVLELMRENDIFILPSENETFGMVYLEAMASGCITICSINDGIYGIIKNGINGFCTFPEASSIHSLLAKIMYTPKETLEQIRLNAIETAKEYTSAKCSTNYLKMCCEYLTRSKLL